MDYNAAARFHEERKRREMEMEMNRFEQEISSHPPAPPAVYGSGPRFEGLPSSYEPLPRGVPAVQFIPHQLQRQMQPPTRSSSGVAAAAGPQVGPFNAGHAPPSSAPSGPSGLGLSATGNTADAFAASASSLVSSTTNRNSNTITTVGYTVTPMGLPPGVTAGATGAATLVAGTSGSKKSKSHGEGSGSKKKKKTIRLAGGQVWEDNSLLEWENDDFRIFCGDLGNDVTDEVLIRAFNKYPSFLKAKVVRDKRSNKTKGYGFVSFKDPQDFMRAMREVNGKYVGSRPIKLRKSTWRDRNMDVVKKKTKEKAKLGLL